MFPGQSAPADVNMTGQKYEQLENLLTQTNLYSKFLSEQMANLAQVRESGGEAHKGNHTP
jgi:hypothetical protein